MNIESLVCSLELSKRLKELGVKQDSLFKWASEDNKITWNIWPNSFIKAHEMAAFTASELGELLPSFFETTINEKWGIDIFNFIMWKIDKEFMINYYSSFPQVPANVETTANIHVRYHIMSEHILDSNLANAMAKCLIMLIENKLMELSNV